MCLELLQVVCEPRSELLYGWQVRLARGRLKSVSDVSIGSQSGKTLHTGALLPGSEVSCDRGCRRIITCAPRSEYHWCVVQCEWCLCDVSTARVSGGKIVFELSVRSLRSELVRGSHCAGRGLPGNWLWSAASSGDVSLRAAVTSSPACACHWDRGPLMSL